MKTARILAILVLALGMASVSLAAEDSWTRKADMPTPRTHLSTSVVDGRIYAIGGSGARQRVEAYDPATDTWIRRANMPTPRWGLSTSAVDGRIYAIGGSGARQRVEAYDPATDTWTRKADMPTARLDLASCVVDGKIYVIGGVDKGMGTALSAVEAYDPVTNTWTKKADMPVDRSALSTSAVDGKIYAIGGASGASGSYVEVSPVGEYDPVTDKWTQKADMLTARGALSTAVVDGKIYAIGGIVSQVSWLGLSTVEMYDPLTDTWVPKADMPTARWLMGNCASVVDGKIYAIGGTTGPPYNGLSTVEEYDPNPLVVDFNGDGIVDCADICIMVEHWHTDEPSCDIAPPPFGDGIVDVQDLIVLAEYLFEEVDDPTLVAHWKLDEAEGTVAHESAGVNDGILNGNPLWQPTVGQVAGALAFDGTDDYVSTPFILDPAAGAFSVFAWIKGGGPGQVVLSQIGGVNWLSADPSAGNLMTELRHIAGRVVGPPLWSQTVITDGDWHRIGFVWDGSYRYLYVDGAEVAKDTEPQAHLLPSDGGLYFGAGKSLDAGSFFSGLIDDVRIYDRAVMP